VVSFDPAKRLRTLEQRGLDHGETMQKNNAVFVSTSPEDPIRSDLGRVDAHVIQPEEYEEIPEITDADLAHAVIRIPGQPDRPVVVDPSLPG
jgi:hypothetical protein